MEDHKEVRWGILGCGDVCEVKSGPAFNKVENSRLVAVMRRDGEKAKDFARRHGVPKYYDDASQLVGDEEINAIYIATPPAFHEAYAILAMEAGKPVYIEKPVALNSESCHRILKISEDLGIKASVAHYRRALPMFLKIKTLLQSGVIGTPSLIICHTLQAPAEKMQTDGYWRTTPEVSGGGLFFDLAPHQLDIFTWLFGEPRQVRAFSLNQGKSYQAPDLTNVEALYGSQIYLHGIWAFNMPRSCEREYCEIIGNKGRIGFSFFKMGEIEVTTDHGTEKIKMDSPENIQHPMIAQVVRFFRGQGPNPCSLAEALITVEVMDRTLTH